MRKRRLWVLLVLIFIVSCRAVLPASLPPAATGLPAPFATQTASPLPTRQPLPASATPAATASRPPASSTALPAPSSTPTELPTLAPTPGPDIPFQVRLHPDGPLYVGDQVSLEIIPLPEAQLPGDAKVTAQVDGPQGQTLGAREFSPYGIGNRRQATFLWAWDTTSLKAGDHQLTFELQPAGLTWTVTVPLAPATQMPNPGAHWASAQSRCCLVHYITGTAAERDLPQLLRMLDAQAEDAAQRLHTTLGNPIPITLMPRVLGQGGFTSSEIAISYLDRNYAGGNLPMVLHHEMIHLLDGRLGGDFRPTMLVEGLAVYLSGGHFKPEPLLPRAAALLPPGEGCIQVVSVLAQTPGCGLNQYQSLTTLADSFYNAQHESAYMEAGALVEFMVQAWGWPAFNAFYRDIHAMRGPNPQARAIDAGLRAHFGLGLAELESRFVAVLRQQQLTSALVEDVRLTIVSYDAMRRYQQALDPSAYYATAWLPDAGTLRQRGLVADLLRHPQQPQNLALEVLLAAANEALLASDYPRVNLLVQNVTGVLDQYDHHAARPFERQPLAQAAFDIAADLKQAGYELQRLRLGEKKAQAWATQAGPDLIQLTLTQTETGWTVNRAFGQAAPYRQAANKNPKYWHQRSRPPASI